jgi:solute carrier family 25 protein 34/35
MSKTPHTIHTEFAIGAIASCGAATLSNPFEVIKVRLQMQGELQKRGVYMKVYKGVLHAFYSIARLEGLRGIQKGLFLAYLLIT